MMSHDEREVGILWQILEVLEDIRDRLPKKAQSATLHLGEDNMPLTIKVGGKATAAPPAFKEFDGPNGTGNEVPPSGPITYVSSDPTIASIDASGAIMGLIAGTVTITDTDSGNGLNASDTLTVEAVAQSATLNLQSA